MLAGAGSERTGDARMIGAPIVLAHEPAFTIGAAELLPATREVVLNGERSVIEPRVMQFLVALHRSDGAVVSKEDLTILCWEGRIVGEDAINRVVSRARAVAENQAGGQFRIETITRVGYRLVPADAATVVRHPAPAAAARRAPRLSRRNLVIGGSAAAVAVAGGGAAWILSRRDTMPAEARRLYEEARSPFFQNTPEQTANTIGKLKQAAQIAPNNADILGLLGFAYVLLATKSHPSQRQELRERGFSAARRALAIDPNQGDALTAFVRGTIMYRNWEAWEQKCRAALRRQPNHDLLNIMMSFLLMQVGRLDESLHYGEIANRLAPDIPPLYWQRCLILWNMGRLDEAEALISRGIALWPSNGSVWFLHVYYLMYNGEAARAAAIVADDSARPPAPDWIFDGVALQAKALATQDPAAVRAAIAKWNELAPSSPTTTQAAAIFAAFVGDFDTSFRMLDSYFFDRGFTNPDASFARVPGIVDRDTYFLFDRPIVAIHRDPRFGRLTKDIGLDDYWTRTGTRSRVVASATP